MFDAPAVQGRALRDEACSNGIPKFFSLKLVSATAHGALRPYEILIHPYEVMSATQLSSPADEDLPARLRHLQRERGWTVQRMAELSGLPQNSLRNYMRKTGAQKPGLEAVASMSRGFEVSADWLLGLRTVEASPPENHALLELAARVVIEQFIASTNHLHGMMKDHPDVTMFPEGRLMGAEPAALAGDYAARFLDLYRKLIAGTVDPEAVKVVQEPDRYVVMMRDGSTVPGPAPEAET